MDCWADGLIDGPSLDKRQAAFFILHHPCGTSVSIFSFEASPRQTAPSGSGNTLSVNALCSSVPEPRLSLL